MQFGASPDDRQEAHADKILGMACVPPVNRNRPVATILQTGFGWGW
jgi:hypothetical protein